jgi:hypothetical protein
MPCPLERAVPHCSNLVPDDRERDRLVRGARTVKNENQSLEQFLNLSVVLTGFERVKLQGTGLVITYYQTFTGIVRAGICDELWKLTSGIIKGNRDDEDSLYAAIRGEILASPEFGPLAINIIQMWYLGSWIQLPQGWRSEFGTSPADVTKVISALAYKNSLIYDVMQAHPPGAKQPGFGSWSLPPAPVRL